ncbi:MAG: ABC transporter permease subunit [Anaerolineae bacterium]|uniref:ABC transporter permease n=1 Tax=Promineifilum sp. TaxID=2664178 RepID=UPI001D68949D|nr:ABC transporter permease subunit [Anaerolineales bacterium]MCB8935314.1 ABC transporter permease subunit [Promineifilum sp.]MCO5180376.1 ABC transporter permease subunit [Promineifilum sp.]MCW5846580.1 ABC transporter permease subunit [Anaerolineae bacterium]
MTPNPPRSPRAAHALLIAAILFGVLLPLLPLVIWSFAHRWIFPDVLPSEWSERAWSYVLSDNSQVGRALVNSLGVAMTVTLLSVLIGLPAGRALALHDFRGKSVVLFLFLAPSIMPVISVAMGIHVAFLRYGLADTMTGVILAHLIPVLPYVTLIFIGVFTNYNLDFEGQARSLGARPIQILRHVMLPAIRPGLIVAGLFAFIISWSQYLLTLLIGGGRVITLPVLLFAFANSGDNAITAALSLVFIAPALLLFLFSARHLSGRNAAMGGLGKL